MIDTRLILVTDCASLPAGRSLEDVVEEACRAGVRAVQLREKELDTRSLCGLAMRLREITMSHDALLFVNDRIDVALAAGADGVHCPENGWPEDAARKILPRERRIGVSTHSPGRAREAQRRGADFVFFGPVFDTHSKRRYGGPQGLDALAEVAASLEIPVYAIGGITAARAAACLERGARGVAVVSALVASDDVAGAVSAFRKALGEL